jgi:hypothetical protein
MPVSPSVHGLFMRALIRLTASPTLWLPCACVSLPRTKILSQFAFGSIMAAPRAAPWKNVLHRSLRSALVAELPVHCRRVLGSDYIVNSSSMCFMRLVFAVTLATAAVHEHGSPTWNQSFEFQVRLEAQPSAPRSRGWCIHPSLALMPIGRVSARAARCARSRPRLEMRAGHPTAWICSMWRSCHVVSVFAMTLRHCHIWKHTCACSA